METIVKTKDLVDVLAYDSMINAFISRLLNAVKEENSGLVAHYENEIRIATVEKTAVLDRMRNGERRPEVFNNYSDDAKVGMNISRLRNAVEEENWGLVAHYENEIRLATVEKTDVLDRMSNGDRRPEVFNNHSDDTKVDSNIVFFDTLDNMRHHEDCPTCGARFFSGLGGEV